MRRSILILSRLFPSTSSSVELYNRDAVHFLWRLKETFKCHNHELSKHASLSTAHYIWYRKVQNTQYDRHVSIETFPFCNTQITLSSNVKSWHACAVLESFGLLNNQTKVLLRQLHVCISVFSLTGCLSITGATKIFSFLFINIYKLL